MRLEFIPEIITYDVESQFLLEAEAKLLKFDYERFGSDPQPRVLVFGRWRNPKTGNKLVCGINVNYLDMDQLTALRDILPDVFGGDNHTVKDKYWFCRDQVPEIIKRAYRTYNQSFIHPIDVKEIALAAKPQTPATPKTPKTPSPKAPAPTPKAAPTPEKPEAPEATKKAPETPETPKTPEKASKKPEAKPEPEKGQEKAKEKPEDQKAKEPIRAEKDRPEEPVADQLRQLAAKKDAIGDIRRIGIDQAIRKPGFMGKLKELAKKTGQSISNLASKIKSFFTRTKNESRFNNRLYNILEDDRKVKSMDDFFASIDTIQPSGKLWAVYHIPTDEVVMDFANTERDLLERANMNGNDSIIFDVHDGTVEFDGKYLKTVASIANTPFGELLAMVGKSHCGT